MASSVFRPRTTSLLTGQNKENEDIKLEEHTLVSKTNSLC